MRIAALSLVHIKLIYSYHRWILGRARRGNTPPKVTLPLQVSVDSTSIWETVNKFLAAFKVKCFKCVCLLHFTPSINFPYKACSPKSFS